MATPPLAVGAAIAGAVCGLAAVGMVWLGERSCDAFTGRPSCGGGGSIMLIAVIAVTCLLGFYLLRMLDVPNAALVAFFGVTLPVIIILLFLIGAVFSAWMVLVLPVMAALCFAGSAVFTSAVQSFPELTYDVAPADDAAGGDRDKQRPGTDEEDNLPRYAPGSSEGQR